MAGGFSLALGVTGSTRVSMISIPGQSGSTCDGFSRREFLRIGGLGMAGISLGDVLRMQASASTVPDTATARTGRIDTSTPVRASPGPTVTGAADARDVVDDANVVW